MSERIKFWIGHGSTVLMYKQSSYREFYIENDIIFASWFGKRYKITDADIVIEVEDIILENKSRLLNFSRKQRANEPGYDSRNLIRGTYKDECSGEIDNDRFSVCNRFNKRELNSFFDAFRKKLMDIIGKSIIDKKAVEIVLCPICHNELKKYYYGKEKEGMDKTKYIISDFESKENSPAYYCDVCNKNFDNEMNEVVEVQ